MNNERIRVVCKVVLSFGVYLLLIRYFKDIKTHLDSYTHIGLLSYLLAYMTALVPIIAGIFWIVGNGDALDSLGFRRNIFRALGWALFFAAPMLSGGLLLFSFPASIDINQLLAGTIIAGFMEEFVYRAFLFGMLFYVARIGFIPAVLINAIPFALAHWNQGNNPVEVMLVLLVTGMAGGFFAWLYVEWERNIWLPIALHTWMNLSWSLFAMGENAAGGAWPNLLRAGTIILAILSTLWWKRRTNRIMAVHRKNLWFEKDSASGSHN
jgi:membrane protease YdiL (CAAX protease family)